MATLWEFVLGFVGWLVLENVDVFSRLFVDE